MLACSVRSAAEGGAAECRRRPKGRRGKDCKGGLGKLPHPHCHGCLQSLFARPRQRARSPASSRA
eukprot:5018711-Pyramimonas_sp.AAC.1